MAIVGIGIDLIEISRIEKAFLRFGNLFLHKIFTPNEQNSFPKQIKAPMLAARFAAKEAAVKALGTGFSEGISFKDIEIFKLSNGKPELYLYRKAQKKALMLGIHKTLVTLTHTRDNAGAVVIFET